MKNYYKLKDVISIFEDDAEKFFQSGNSAAGTRLRKAMQEVKVLSQALRSEVSDIKKKAVKEVKEDLILY
ncbi:histone H1 [Sphingobacterium sp. SYP-B4668]|uniref:histone H1 n=1 Tax=Sphingobacterium sp. SYP-B4668 TaxID=2996035 RepID=UPI0022DD66BE|nr:histone H1 [Sphingobacterium sp. SYP-B4668]